MQLVFDGSDEADEERFFAVRRALLDEMRVWVAERFGDHEGERVAWAETFIGWKYNYGDGDLADITKPEAYEYLVDWCPRKVSVPADAADEVCRGLSAYVEFMHVTGRLRGGSARAAELISSIEDLLPEVKAGLSDPSKFGLAKSLFAVPLEGADGLPLPDLSTIGDLGHSEIEQLQAVLDQRMHAFNALPFEQRKAYTDPIVQLPKPRVELDYVHVMPPQAEVEAAISASPLIRMVLGLVDWVGESGQAITSAGNFKLADARMLVERLRTGDSVDSKKWGSGSTRSSRELPVLSMVCDLAEMTGAIRLLTTRVKVAPNWRVMSSLEQAEAIIKTLLDVGPLTIRGVGRINELFEQLADLLDAGVDHWLMGVLPPGEERQLDEVFEIALDVIDRALPREGERWSESMWERIVEGDLHTIFETLEFAGLIELRSRRQIADQWGGLRHTGGSFVATTLARHVMPDRCAEAGFDFVVIPDLATATASQIVDACVSGTLSPEELLAAWLPGGSSKDRIEAIAAVVGESDRPHVRVAGFALIEGIGDLAAGEGSLRRLLDTPASGHAAMCLIHAGVATPEELGGFVGVGPLVDVLASMLDDPQDLVDAFTQMQSLDGDDLLERLWRCRQPETIEVLDALGKFLPDKALAKAARKAVIRHRSWIANLDA